MMIILSLPEGETLRWEPSLTSLTVRLSPVTFQVKVTGSKGPTTLRLAVKLITGGWAPVRTIISCPLPAADLAVTKKWTVAIATSPVGEQTVISAESSRDFSPNFQDMTIGLSSQKHKYLVC